MAEKTSVSLDGDTSGLITALRAAQRALDAAGDSIGRVSDALNNNLVRSSSKATKAMNDTAKASKASAQQVVTSLQSEQKAAEGYARSIEILDKKLKGMQRNKGESQKSFNERIGATIASTRNLPSRGVTTGGADARFSPQSRDNIIQYQRSVAALAQKEKELEQQRVKAARDQRMRDAEEKRAASEKLLNAKIAAVTSTFNLPAIAKASGIQQFDSNGKLTEQFKQLQLDSVVVSKSLAGIRYALYDISRSATIAGAAILAAVVIPAKAAIDLDRQFADVRRTTGLVGEEAANLKNEFIDLAQTLPIAFSELARIGTLAGQLNIGKASIANFTANVAKFSATTDVSVTESATAFGRLGELIDGVNGQYQKLGSAILKVGTESVATESQIINTAQQIAAIGNAANLSADEVIAFSGALASLGTTPELSRGLVTRLFSNINNAISLGGRNLQEYDRLVAQTGKSFTDLWQADSAGALVEFFRGISYEGSAAAKTLNDIGITSVRDVPAILRLSQNLSLLEKLLADSNIAFAQGIEINKQYGVIADTVAAKLERLGNNFNLLFAGIGDSALLLGPVVDAINALIVGFTNLIRNPVTSIFLGAVGAIASVVGIMSLLVGAITKVGASGLAVTQVVLIVKEAMGLLKTEGIGAAIALLTEGEAAQSAAIKNNMLGSAMLGVVRNSFILKTALRGLISASIIGAAFVALSAIIEGVSNSMKSASEQAKDYFGDLGGLVDAVKADTEAFDGTQKVIAKTTIYLKDNAQATVDNQVAAMKLAGAFDETAAAAANLNDSLSQQAIYGDQVGQFLENAFITNADIQKVANDPQITKALESMGFSFAELVRRGLSGTGGGAQGYLSEITSGLQAEINSLQLQGATLDSGNIQFTTQSARLGELTYLQGALNGSVGEFAKQTDNAKIAVEQSLQTEALASSVMRDLGLETTLTSSDISDMVSILYDAPNKILAADTAFAELGAQFASGGKSAIATSAEMQSAVKAIIEVSGTGSQSVANLSAFIQFLEVNGYATAEAIQYLQGAISTLGGEANGAVQSIDFSAFLKGMNDVGSSTTAAAKAVRSLDDYANDLQNTFSRAFDLRFKKQLEMDSITKSWRDLSEEIANAKNEVNGLTADRATLEYFLSVAEAYGDTIRANKLRAQIAKMDGQIADATANSSTELEGNSDAAINNRAKLAALVSGYQSYIATLASSGASQKEINRAIAQSRQQFLDQAIALGFSEDQLGIYNKSFVDMGRIVKSIPRDVTIDANVNPAIQALNEFVAQARNAGDNAGSAFSSAFLQSQRTAMLKAYASGKMNYYRSLLSQPNLTLSQTMRYADGLDEWKAKYDSYATGGYTGNGGKYQPAGIVHRGEYVMPANIVSQYGIGFFDQLTQMRNPSYSVGASAAPTTMMVALSPDDRALLRGNGGSGDIVIAVDSREIARASARGSRLVTAEGGYLNG